MGQIVRAFNRLEVNAANYVVGSSAWLPLLKNVPAANFREVTLAVRLHYIKAALVAGVQINFGVFGSAPTEEDPTQEYLTGGGTTPLFMVSLTTTTAGNFPLLLTASNFTPPVATGNNPTAGYYFPVPGFITVAQQVVIASSAAGDVLLSGDVILK